MYFFETRPREVPAARFELCMHCYRVYTEKESKAATRIQATSRQQPAERNGGSSVNS